MSGIPVPFSDISKPTNDLLNKDFYHVSPAALEIKSKAPNGVNFNVKGKSSEKGPITGSLEGKYTDKASGLALTQTWSTTNALDTKIELDDNLTKGLKAEILTQYLPAAPQTKYGAKLNLHYKQPNLHTRLLTDLTGGPITSFDVTFGHEGFLVGAEAGYNVNKAAITKYALAAGYSQASYAAALTAGYSLPKTAGSTAPSAPSVFTAGYYHKVNSQVEVGAKATWDSSVAANNVGLEIASKYKLDPSSFAKAKINDSGIAALAYNVKLSPGVTLGLGASFDTQKLNQAAHKVGASFTFEG